MIAPSPHTKNVYPAAPTQCRQPIGSHEEALNDFTRLAALLCDMPFALLTFTDGTRHQFPAFSGGEDAATPDWVSFRACTPLASQNGQILGTLRVMDLVPRVLTAAQREALQVLAHRIAETVELQQQFQASKSAEEALSEREPYLQRANSILQVQQEAAIDGILILDEDRRIVSDNRRFCDLWGIPDSLAARRDDAPILASVVAQVRDPDAFLSKVEYLYDHPGETSRDEIRLNDGRILDRYSGPVVGEEGQDLGRIWYFRDVTEQKRAEEALRAGEERLRAVVAGLPLILFTLDADAVITLSEGRGLNALGLTPGEDVGKSMLVLYAGSPEVQGAIRRALSGETVAILQEFAAATFETQLIPQCDDRGRTFGVIGVAVDVTERRWAEQQIRGLNAELEQRLDRIVVLNFELSQAYDATIEG